MVRCGELKQMDEEAIGDARECESDSVGRWRVTLGSAGWIVVAFGAYGIVVSINNFQADN